MNKNGKVKMIGKTCCKMEATVFTSMWICSAFPSNCISSGDESMSPRDP